MDGNGTPLTAQLVSSLIANNLNKPRKTYRMNGQTYNGSPSAANAGLFEGKVGRMRRSRKGRTYRAPGGTRYYLSDAPTASWYQA